MMNLCGSVIPLQTSAMAATVAICSMTIIYHPIHMQFVT